MASVTKTWNFNTNPESIELFSCNGDGVASVSRDSSLSALNIVFVQNNLQQETFSIVANTSGTSTTWETWGVPSNNEISSVEIISYQYRIEITSGLQSQPSISIRITDNSNNSIIASDLVSEIFDEGTKGSWAEGTSLGLILVNSGKKISTTNIKLEIQLDYATDGVDLAQTQHLLDDIQLQINYAPAASQTKYYIIS